jgi:hypothetical protein
MNGIHRKQSIQQGRVRQNSSQSTHLAALFSWQPLFIWQHSSLCGCVWGCAVQSPTSAGAHLLPNPLSRNSSAPKATKLCTGHLHTACWPVELPKKAGWNSLTVHRLSRGCSSLNVHRLSRGCSSLSVHRLSRGCSSPTAHRLSCAAQRDSAPPGASIHNEPSRHAPAATRESSAVTMYYTWVASHLPELDPT